MTMKNMISMLLTLALLCAGGTFIVLSFIGMIVYFILKATGVF